MYQRLFSLLPRRWRKPALPHAIIIGAQKCGTSALAYYLNQHPKLVGGKEKELKFFGSDLRFQRGLGWYADQWPKKRGATLRFEASPQYMHRAPAAGRIRACVPHARLIALVREPVERAYSSWRMYRRQLADDPNFYRRLLTEVFGEAGYAKMTRRTAEELENFCLAVAREIECLERGGTMEWPVVELGLYGFQLKRFLDLFPRNQLLIIDSSDLRLCQKQTLNTVLGHLGLDAFDWSQVDLSEVFVGGPASQIPQEAEALLRNYYTPSNQLLAEIMSNPPAWARSPRSQAA